MKNFAPHPFLWPIPALVSCAFLGQTAQPAADPPPSQHQVSSEEKQAVRQLETQAEAAQEPAMAAERREIDQMEQDLVNALKLALGQQAASPGAPPPQSSAVVLAALRKAKIRLRIERVVDQDGRPVNDNLLQLKDSYTDRVQQLQRRIVENTVTKAESKEIQEGAKYTMKINDLRMQIMNLSRAAVMSNSMLQTTSLGTMLRVADMVRTRKSKQMDLDDADYARVKRWLARQRQVEAVAATALGALATYQAVIEGGGDPKALDLLAENTLQGFPVNPQVTDREAKDYVVNLNANVGQIKAKYEQMMRKIHGDAKYEQQYKASIDATFARAMAASSEKSSAEISADAQKKYQTDLENCAQGQPAGPGSLVGPARCKQAREARLAGKPLPSPATMAANVAENAANQAANTLSDTAADLIPGLSTIKNSLEGIEALAKGDAKGALNAAVRLVPGGSIIGKGLSLASKLLGL